LVPVVQLAWSQAMPFHFDLFSQGPLVHLLGGLKPVSGFKTYFKTDDTDKTKRNA